MITAHVREWKNGNRRFLGKRNWFRAWGGGDRPGCFFPDFSDKSDALAGKGLDEPLLYAGVTDGRTDGVDASGECRFGNDAPCPNGFDQSVTADDTIAVLDQEFEQIENLGFNRYRPTWTP